MESSKCREAYRAGRSSSGSSLEGWRLNRINGSHHLYTHSAKPGYIVVPHPRKDMPIGTLKNIFRRAGWSWPDRKRE
ncbi:MAG: addiction module toxin, HicA family [Alphaproteobacteria bacterium]|nr:addiction module toxin, HicA family [Alphaproteobacteria bacterium]